MRVATARKRRLEIEPLFFLFSFSFFRRSGLGRPRGKPPIALVAVTKTRKCFPDAQSEGACTAEEKETRHVPLFSQLSFRLLEASRFRRRDDRSTSRSQSGMYCDRIQRNRERSDRIGRKLQSSFSPQQIIRFGRGLATPSVTCAP